VIHLDQLSFTGRSMRVGRQRGTDASKASVNTGEALLASFDASGASANTREAAYARSDASGASTRRRRRLRRA
jgi:hypothetical protein